jgi:hypothetical protein
LAVLPKAWISHKEDTARRGKQVLLQSPALARFSAVANNSAPDRETSQQTIILNGAPESLVGPKSGAVPESAQCLDLFYRQKQAAVQPRIRLKAYYRNYSECPGRGSDGTGKDQG